MSNTTILWAVPGRAPHFSDSGSVGDLRPALDFAARGLDPVRPIAFPGRTPAGTPEGWSQPAVRPTAPAAFGPQGGLPIHQASSSVSHLSTPRSMTAFLEPIEKAARSSQSRLLRLPGPRWARDEGPLELELPHYQFTGPQGGDEPIRLGVFATIHGDEPESGLGLARFLQVLAERPETAEGFVIQAYPLCNPTGYVDGTRHSRRGKDLNREFWRDSSEPEVRLLEAELLRHRFHGIISLHCDDTSHGLYGFLSGRQAGDVLSASLLEPALRAAEEFLPRNFDPEIDGFHARGGVLSSCYDGVLRAPDGVSQPPFEITFETPQRASLDRQVEAFNGALHTILQEYRLLLAHAPNL